MADYYTSIALTGIAPAVLDASFRCYLEQIADGGPDYHTDVYSDEDCTALIGHTAGYSTTGAKAVVADNDSGLGGTVTVATLAATATAVTAHYGRWTTVASITDALLTVDGRAVNEGTIPYLWYGDHSQVEVVPFNVPGSFATANEADALRDLSHWYARWLKRRAHLAYYYFTAVATAGATEPRVQMYVDSVAVTTKNSSEGWELSTTPGTFVTASDLTAGLGIANKGSTIEVGVTIQGGGSADDEDLVLYSVWVFE